MTKISNKYIKLAIIAGCIVILDQVTKAVILRTLPLNHSISIVPGFFNLIHIQNPGGAFGFMAKHSSAWLHSVFLFFTFLALGFHPKRTEQGEFRRGLQVTVILLVIIFCVLALTTAISILQINQEHAVEEIFTNEVVARAGRVSELNIIRSPGGILITTTIIDLAGNKLTPAEIDEIDKQLEETFFRPVTVGEIIPGRKIKAYFLGVSVAAAAIICAAYNHLDMFIFYGIDHSGQNVVGEFEAIGFGTPAISENSQVVRICNIEAPVTVPVKIGRGRYRIVFHAGS